MGSGHPIQWPDLPWQDILYAALAATTQFVAAWLGWSVTTRARPLSPRRKMLYHAIFFSCGMLGIVMVGFTAYRSSKPFQIIQQGQQKEIQGIDQANKGINQLQKKPTVPSMVYLPTPREPQPKPDIGMEFVNPEDVSFAMVNLSQTAVLRDPKYFFVLLDLDGPRTVKTNFGDIPQVLPIPAFSDAGDFLKAGRKFLQRPIVSTFPAVQSIVKPNDRIFGSVTVSCPDCIKDRHYLVFFVNGSGGWYCESTATLRLPMQDLLKDADETLLKLVPLKKRIPIRNAAN
jgi:hypothetical protein